MNGQPYYGEGPMPHDGLYADLRRIECALAQSIRRMAEYDEAITVLRLRIEALEAEHVQNQG